MNIIYLASARLLISAAGCSSISSAISSRVNRTIYFLKGYLLFSLLWPLSLQAATQSEINNMREQALAYLFTNQDSDGFWDVAGKADIQTTAMALHGFYNNGITQGIHVNSALSWLSNTQAYSINALGQQTGALGLFGWDVTDALDQLSANINGRYAAWGSYDGYQPSMPDTAIAHDAWFLAGVTSPTSSATTTYVRSTAQNTDGGWPYMAKTLVGAVSGSSRVIPTAYSVITLSRYKSLGTGSQTDITQGINWLLGQQLGDGGFADDLTATTSNAFETALVLYAIKTAKAAGNGTANGATTPIDDGLDYLINSQALTGAWNDDLMATATVLNALANVTLLDGDKDGIPDGVELLTFTDPLVADAGALITGIGDAIAGLTTAESILVEAQAGETFSFFLPFSGGTSISFFAGGGLPAGLTLNALTGELSGIPESGGDYPFSYTVSFADGEPQESVVMLSIEGPMKVNVPLPIWSIIGLALLLLPISWWGRAKQTIVSFAFVGLVISLLTVSPNTLAEAKLPANTAKQITDAFIDHPAKRNETVRSITEHVDNLSKALEEYHSEDARKMFAKAHRTAIDALNKRLNEELAGKQNRFNNNASSSIQLDKTQIANKDASLQAMFSEIDALQSLDGDKVLGAFLSLRKRLNKAKGIRYSKHPVPTWTNVGDMGEALEIPESQSIPAYLSDTYRDRAQNMIAFNGDILLLASAPNTSAEAQSCGYSSTDLADDGQDITITPEISALAEKLNYSTVNIFEYVANEIEFEPYYGAMKGAHATLMTKSGSATDQSSLLIALLRASNIPARYVRGDIEADIGTSNEKDSRIAKWLQMDSLLGAVTRLGVNGNPAANIYAPNDWIRFSHIWVEACVPYAHYQGAGVDQLGHRWIPLDPSYETRHYTDTLAANATFDFDEYLNSYKTKMPEEFLEEKVNAAVLEADKNIKDVGYRSVKDQITIDVLPASLPYNVRQYTNWSNSGTPETAELPDGHRYFYHVDTKNSSGVSLGASVSVPMREVVLDRITLYYKGATASHETSMQNWRLNGGSLPTNLDLVPVISIDGQVVATGTVSVKSNTVENKMDMRVTMDEYRYTSPNKPNCPAVSGTQLINDACFDTLRASNYHSLQAWAYQSKGKVLESMAAELITHVNQNPLLATDIDNTLGRFLHFVSLGYMKDISAAYKRIGQLTHSTGDSSIHLGITGSQSFTEKVLDLPFGVIKTGFYVDAPGVKSLSKDLDTGLNNYDAFFAASYAASAYESHIWQEAARLDAVSTIRGIQFAQEQGYDVLTINTANQTIELNKLIAVDNGNSGSAAYPSGFKNFLINTYLSQGFEIKIPDRRINYQGWEGHTLVGTKNDSGGAIASFPIAGGYAGGYTVSDPINWGFDPIYNTGYLGGTTISLFDGGITGGSTSSFDLNPAIFQSDYGTIGNGGGISNTFAGDPVNLVTGNFYHTERDISIPHRDLPFVFERVYNSREPQDGSLGFGWTHSFNHKLVFLDELTDEQETAADTNGTTQSIVWIDGTGGEKRIEVSGASSSGVTGSTTFTNREGQYFNFVRETNGSFTITEKNGLIYRFEASAGDVDDEAKLTQIQSRNGNTLTLTYNGNELDKVTDSTSRFISFTYTANRISRVEDWTGRAHEYTYSVEGDLISYKNPLALTGEQEPVSYDYFTATDAPTIDHAIKSITLPKGNGMDFEYYVDGRVFRHTNTAGETFSFQYNDFRRETIVTDSRGYTKQYFFNEYGNPVEIINEEGGISTYEYTDPSDHYLRTAVVNEARLRTEYEYNSNGTLVLQRNPSGSTVEYSNFNAFEQPGKIKDANGNYSLLKYDAEGNVTDKIALKAGVGSSVIPSSYVPAQADLLSWITNNYSSAGNLLSSTKVRDVTTAEGFNQQWQFDANQLYATQIQRCGDKNGDGVINTSTDDPCDIAILQYDTLGRLALGVNSRFEKVEYRYDDLNRVVRGTDALGNIRDFGFDANGNANEQHLNMMHIGNNYLNRALDTVEGNAENLSLIDSSSSRFNDSDRLRVSLDAGGNATYFSYDPMGNVETVTNPDNYTIVFEYDGLGRVTSAFDEEGREAKRDLDPIGRMRSLTDPNGNAETFNYYDAANDGRLQKQCEAAANGVSAARCTTFVYDNNGNVTYLTDNAGSLTSTTYDALNRPVRIVEPIYTDPVHGQVRPVTKYTYDLLGNSTQIQAGYTNVLGLAANDALSTQQTNLLDDWGRVLNVTNALGQVTEYQYNTQGDLIVERVPTTALAPNGYNLGIDVLGTFDIARQYTYGGLLLKEDQLNYTYNPLGQVTSIKGRRQGTFVNTGSIYSNNYSYSYDTAHRLKSETGSGLTKTYTISPGGLLEKASIKRGNITDTINYRYDKTGRLQSIGYNDAQHVNYVFDDGGRLKQKRYPGNVNQSYSYYNDNRLKQLLVKGTSTLLQQDLTYDTLGRRSTLTENLNGVTTNSSYSYDALSRLTSETIGSQTQSFEYDQFGNRITHNKFDGSTDFYQHNAAHQLKTLRENNASGAIKARYGYTPKGDLHRVCEGTSAASVTTDGLIRGECDLRDYQYYGYNVFGQMTQTSTYHEPGTNPVTHEVFQYSTDATPWPNLEQHYTQYEYDAAGRRMQVSGGTLHNVQRNYAEAIEKYTYAWQENINQHNTQYRYNGEAIYLSYKTGNSISNPNARWLHGAGVDEPLIRYGSDGSITNYHQNGRNSAVLTTSVNSGAVVAKQSFDAFGNVQQSSGTIEQYGYTGREPDASGLMYYRARYYDSQRGRFLQRDPKGMIDGINQYAYVRNNPVNRIDPNGTVSVGTNNFTSLNTNYFSGGGNSSQSLFNTNNNFDISGMADTSSSLNFNLGNALQTIGDFGSGFVSGVGSVGTGLARAVRQVGRTTGLLGADAFNSAADNGRQLDRAVGAAFDAGRAAGQVLGQNPNNLDLARQGAGFVTRKAVDRLATSNANEIGRVVGRVVTSLYLSPLGAAAAIGDFLTSVERQGPNIDTTLDFLLFGGDG